MHTSGNRIRKLRREKGTSVREISAIVERDQSLISRYERGLTQVPDDAKRKLADHFGVSVPYLMGWDTDDEQEAAA